MPLRIRSARAEDESLVTRLLQTSYATLLRTAYDEELLRKALPLMSRANPLLLRCGTWYLALGEGEKLVACGGWTFEDPATKEAQVGKAHMRHFACHPDHLRQGIGAQLAMHSFEKAALEGVREIECCSTLNAESFYQGLGFERFALVAVALGHGVEFPGVQMRRRISPITDRP